MASETVREIVARLHTSANALAALGAALDARVTDVPLDPAIRPHVEGVLAALGLDTLDGTTGPELRSMLGELRGFALTNAKLLFAASRGAGWQHTEPAILEAAGDVSAAFPHALENTIAPNLEGLADRLAAPGASFLDVGVGVAVMSIEMARVWPSLRIVGIDPWGPALAMAKERVRAARLEARIELREQAGEDLPDRDAFDLAWIPSVFVPGHAVARLLRRVHGALRSGGWLLFPTMRPSADRLGTALARLRTSMYGGFVTTPEQIEHLLRETGFASVRTLPAPPTALTAMIVGRRER